MASPKTSRCPSKDSTAAAGSAPGFKTIGSNRKALRYVVQTIYKSSKYLSTRDLRTTKRRRPRIRGHRRFVELWRCRDSNPGPPTDPPQHLRAYPPVLFSSSAHRPAGGPSRTSRESLARAVTAPNAGQPELIDTRRPASGRADRKMGGKEPVRASTYAARAKLSFAVNISRRFNECPEHLGTPPRIHRTRRNLSSP